MSARGAEHENQVRRPFRSERGKRCYRVPAGRRAQRGHRTDHRRPPEPGRAVPQQLRSGGGKGRSRPVPEVGESAESGVALRVDALSRRSQQQHNGRGNSERDEQDDPKKPSPSR